MTTSEPTRFTPWRPRKRPRVLVHGDVPGSEALATVFPTVVHRPLDASDVDRSAYDLIVTSAKDLGQVPPGVFVLTIGSISLERPANRRPPPDRMIQFLTFDSNPIALGDPVIPTGLPDAVRRLVEDDLLPSLSTRGVCRAWGLNQGGTLIVPQSLSPFAFTSSGRAVAGEWTRPRGAMGWALPDGVDVVAWARAAADCWRAVSPQRFPPWKPWDKDRDWFTAQQLRLAEEADALASAWRAAEAEHAREEAAIQERLADASLAAAKSERLLLDGQGGALMTTVMAVLRQMGFTVEDCDSTRQHGDSLEDLRVADQGDSDWIAIVEVRGYSSGGAKSADLLRLARFAARYRRETGREPSARWYVVNQMASTEPSGRHKAFASQPDDLAQFAEDGGLVIDTRDLFRAIRNVDLGRESAESLRERIKSSRGLFVQPEG